MNITGYYIKNQVQWNFRLLVLTFKFHKGSCNFNWTLTYLSASGTFIKYNEELSLHWFHSFLLLTVFSRSEVLKVVVNLACPGPLKMEVKLKLQPQGKILFWILVFLQNALNCKSKCIKLMHYIINICFFS